MYRFPDYATKEHRDEFREGIERIVSCLQSRISELKEEIPVYILAKVEYMHTQEKQGKDEERRKYHSELREKMGEFDLDDENFVFEDWICGIHDIVMSYANNTDILRRAVNMYCKLASCEDYAEDVFSKNALLNRAEDTAKELLLRDPAEKEHVLYLLKGIESQRKS